ncbi:MAG: Panacea domain-containing protein [Methanobacteriaceae archaeon]
MNNIKYDNEKMKELIHYIIDKCKCKNNVGRTVLYKLLYFSDFNYYEIYETPITKEIYLKFPKGPVPIHFKEIKSDLIKEGKISEDVKPLFYGNKYNKYDYNSLKTPKIKILEKKEIEVIDAVIYKLGAMKANEISDYSHGDMPWKVAKYKEALDYEYVFYRDKKYAASKHNIHAI